MTILFTKIATIASLLLASTSISCARGENVVKAVYTSDDSGVKDFPAYSSKLVSSYMPLPAFTSISSSNNSNIVFVQTDGEYSLRATGHIDDPLRHLDIKVENGVLQISRREAEGGVVRNSGVTRFIDQFITIFISGKQLKGINMSGTADFFCEKISQQTPFNAIMRGTGDINVIYLSVNQLTVNLHGTGDFKSKNTNAPDCRLNLMGTGEIDIDNLVSSYISAILSGTGDFKLPSILTSDITAVLSGLGDMKLGGKCTDSASFSVPGMGDLRAKKLTAERVTATVTGTGSLECTPISNINATRTNGDLTYFGSPKTVKTSGNVRNSK